MNKNLATPSNNPAESLLRTTRPKNSYLGKLGHPKWCEISIHKVLGGTRRKKLVGAGPGVGSGGRGADCGEGGGWADTEEWEQSGPPGQKGAAWERHEGRHVEGTAGWGQESLSDCLSTWAVAMINEV